MKLRVAVTDVWDTVKLAVPSTTTFADVKASSLEQALGRPVDPSAYQIKFRGALVTDEARTLEAADVPDDAALIVLAAHRRPVR
jgi:hypothetical protein